MRTFAAALAVLAACAAPVIEIEPVIDSPADPDGAPAGVDVLEVAVAHAGSAVAIASATFAQGGSFALPEVPFADDLVVHLVGRIGATPVAYGRTCAFAVSAAADPPRPHLWFARTVTFGALGHSIAGRRGGWAIAHPTGALFGGGTPPALVRFDALRGALETLGESSPRTGAAAALIGGTAAPAVAVIGGELDGQPAPLLELIDLATGARIDRVEDSRLARAGASATALTDGRVIVIGGTAPGGAASGDLLEVSTGSTGTELRTARVTLAHPRAGHTATRLGDDVGAPVLIVGGTGASGPIAAAELWKPLSGTLADPVGFARPMKRPRHHHVAQLMPDGSVLVIGGVGPAGEPILELERFTVDGGFELTGQLPAGAGIVEMSATRLPDGRILIAGGRAAPGGPPVDSAAIARLDLVDGTVDVVQTDRLTVPRAGHGAAVLCDGTVLIGDGAADGTPGERYNPPPQGRR